MEALAALRRAALQTVRNKNRSEDGTGGGGGGGGGGVRIAGIAPETQKRFDPIRGSLVVVGSESDSDGLEEGEISAAEEGEVLTVSPVSRKENIDQTSARELLNQTTDRSAAHAQTRTQAAQIQNGVQSELKPAEKKLRVVPVEKRPQVAPAEKPQGAVTGKPQVASTEKRLDAPVETPQVSPAESIYIPPWAVSLAEKLLQQEVVQQSPIKPEHSSSLESTTPLQPSIETLEPMDVSTLSIEAPSSLLPKEGKRHSPRFENVKNHQRIIPEHEVHDALSLVLHCGMTRKDLIEEGLHPLFLDALGLTESEDGPITEMEKKYEKMAEITTPAPAKGSDIICRAGSCETVQSATTTTSPDRSPASSGDTSLVQGQDQKAFQNVPLLFGTKGRKRPLASDFDSFTDSHVKFGFDTPAQVVLYLSDDESDCDDDTGIENGKQSGYSTEGDRDGLNGKSVQISLTNNTTNVKSSFTSTELERQIRERQEALTRLMAKVAEKEKLKPSF